eukprot:CAMPEP_0194275838 /NCGR_PEP_ID=MMETSP0169-20130528/8578_1 /TAXON_ID=218684 /ORGANISM="Corethron pennatum, Strain L29A3" /LENGTH=363 /DNA_ID=CAMNT_0039019403 /DNA_START=105 /DNA_END=1196 /DNA_ORIENTATION=+
MKSAFFLLLLRAAFSEGFGISLPTFRPKSSPLRGSDSGDDAFSPSFDGQLVYGKEMDKNGAIKVTKWELKNLAASLASTFGVEDEPPYWVDVANGEIVVGGASYSVRPRTVPVPGSDGVPWPDGAEMITIYELEHPSLLVEDWIDTAGSCDAADPFGAVMWPGSIAAGRILLESVGRTADGGGGGGGPSEGITVLVLGAGTGVEAQAAARALRRVPLGEGRRHRVLATDVSPIALALLEYGAQQAGMADIIRCEEFDIFSDDPLPACDVLVVADVLYNENLARRVGRRVDEALETNPPPRVLVTDSQRFHGTDFLEDVNSRRKGRPGREPLAWSYTELVSVTASGVLIEEDQTYDIKVRYLDV